MSKRRMIKTFTTGLNMNIDDEMNKFLEENNATPVSLSTHYLHDTYEDGRVCNRWVEIVMIYEVDVPKKNWPVLKDGEYYCPNCAGPIDVTKNYCNACGAKIEIPNMSGK